MPASRCMVRRKACPALTLTAPVHRCWRSSPNRTCVRRPRQWLMRRSCTNWYSGSASATAICRKAASVVTSMYPSGQKARINSVPAARSRTSTRSSSCSRRSSMRPVGRSRPWKTAARSSRPPCFSIRIPARLAPCVARRRRTIIAISLTLTYCHWKSPRLTSRLFWQRCRNCHKPWWHALSVTTNCQPMMPIP